MRAIASCLKVFLFILNECNEIFDKNKNKFFINSRGTKAKSIEIKAQENGLINFNGSKYEGSLILIIKNNLLYLINKLILFDGIAIHKKIYSKTKR